MQGLGKKRVPKQYRCIWSKLTCRGTSIPAQIGGIHDIIVHQCRQMYHLNHPGRPHQIFVYPLLALPSADEDQSRPQTLA